MLVQLMNDLEHEFPCPMAWIKVGQLRSQNTEKQRGRGLGKKKKSRTVPSASLCKVMGKTYSFTFFILFQGIIPGPDV